MYILYIISWPSNPSINHRESLKHVCKEVYIGICCSIVYCGKSWKQPECPLIKSWNKPWYVHTLEYYATVKIMNYVYQCGQISKAYCCLKKKVQKEMIP